MTREEAVTIKDALLLEAALGIDADIWVGLQNDYDKQKATKLERLKEING